ncbi:hypothetical protein LSAT2_021891, partial [Lamellibrachia satsuma]
QFLITGVCGIAAGVSKTLNQNKAWFLPLVNVVKDVYVDSTTPTLSIRDVVFFCFVCIICDSKVLVVLHSRS